jgi:hypothetical protein
MYAENLRLLTIITLECFYSHSTKLKAAGPAAAVRVPVTFFAGPGFPARVKWPRSLRLEPSSGWPFSAEFALSRRPIRQALLSHQACFGLWDSDGRSPDRGRLVSVVTLNVKS